jgi:hypothetical protein
VGSNPAGGKDDCVRSFCVCVVLCVGSGLARAEPPSKESYRLCIGVGTLKRRPRDNKRVVEPNQEKISTDHVEL